MKNMRLSYEKWSVLDSKSPIAIGELSEQNSTIAIGELQSEDVPFPVSNDVVPAFLLIVTEYKSVYMINIIIFVGIEPNVLGYGLT